MRITILMVAVVSLTGCVGLPTLMQASGQVGSGLSSGFQTLACGKPSETNPKDADQSASRLDRYQQAHAQAASRHGAAAPTAMVNRVRSVIQSPQASTEARQ